MFKLSEQPKVLDDTEYYKNLIASALFTDVGTLVSGAFTGNGV